MNHRHQKLVSQIQRILGEIFVQEGKAWGVNLISINDIVMSSDLSEAKVWVSFIGEKNQEGAFKNLSKRFKAVQSLFYKKLAMRHVPKLAWQLDEDPTKHYRIEEILDDISRSQNKN
jgi:ribosome-binding factor A